MPPEEKPYRVYKGGRQKGKVPAPPRPERAPKQPAESAAGSGAGGRRTYRAGGRPPRRRRRRRWLRILLVLVGLFLVWVVAWGLAGFLALRGGVGSANQRLDPKVERLLTRATGDASNILLLGTDHAATAGREADRHSDSIMLVRADGKRHRIAYLSIPRDLYVDIPGYGRQKINFAYQAGGPALALRTVRALTGLPVNHVAIVDFADFRSLIDAVGGVSVNNPRPILSNRFDCPYKTSAQCEKWEGWRFAKGTIHLNGHQALIYSRVRENRLDPSESDVTRGERQQQVLRAVTGKLTSFGTFTRLPFEGGKLLKPLATDLSAWQFLKLGWVKFRTSGSSTLHCRLGGEGSFVGGLSVIVPDELNRSVIAMFTGDSAPQPPPPGSGAYGPGCVTGNGILGSR